MSGQGAHDPGSTNVTGEESTIETNDILNRMRPAILRWHDENARALPWRGEKDPYRIFVSEIMLQQTRAETVIGYYHAFLSRFPTWQALADADVDEVLKCWEGLGYYSRARNVFKCAQVVSRELNGQIPRDIKELKKLPGIGDYTAGALASMAFGLPEPAIDGNLVRVLSRLFAMDQLVSTPASKRQLREDALQLIDHDRPGDFNQALMGMGALICVPKKPRCDDCPVCYDCRARALGIEAALPVLPAIADKRIEKRTVALVFHHDRVLVRKRPDVGLLAGLWEFPNFLEARTDAAVLEALGEMGVRAKKLRSGIQRDHVFTHIVWKMAGRLYKSIDGRATQGQFVDAQTLLMLAMPTAMKPYRDVALAEIADQ